MKKFSWYQNDKSNTATHSEIIGMVNTSIDVDQELLNWAAKCSIGDEIEISGVKYKRIE